MKRIISVLLVISILLLSLTGCDAGSEASEDIFEALQKQKFIEKDLEYVDTVTKVTAGLFLTRTTYYIYQDQESNLIAINIDKNIYKKYDYDYVATVYCDVTVDSNVHYVEDTSSLELFYTYTADHTKSRNNKYVMKEASRYNIYKKDYVLFKRFIIKEEE